MTDSLTDLIIQKLNDLPIAKKKAILELIKEDSTQFSQKTHLSLANWREELLKTSVWSDEEIDEIYKAREYINSWTPKQFF